MDRIGVRELRQHASRYLDRVRAGETIEVTDRGTPVARLVPITEESWDALVASGQVLDAQNPELDVGDLEVIELGFSASDELDQLRSEER